MSSQRLVRFLCSAAVAVAASGLTAAAASAANTLQGQGSTLVAPLEGEWATAWAAASGNPVPTYLPVGSGKGLAAIGSGLVDFGASDAPTSASTTPCPGCFQIPWALTATGIGFNLGSIHSLRLTPKVVAEIYLGQITKWNNSAIKKLNKHVKLPNEKITPLHRLDASGDSYAFTDLESDVSSTFAHRISRGTKPVFKVGPGATGNSGMVTLLNQTPGSIAYIAVSYLIGNKLPAAALQNNAGKFETPNIKNIQSAAASANITSNLELHIVNPPRSARIAYPLSTFTYAILRSPDPLGNGAELKSFVQYALSSQGQSLGPRLDFAPLPSKVLNADANAVNQIR